VADTTFDPTHPTVSENVKTVEVTVPEGTKFFRFATFAEDYKEGTDVDLYAFKKDGDKLTSVGSSGGPTAEESITLTGAGTYVVFVQLWSAPDGQTSVTVKHHSWIVGDAAGNLTLTPASDLVTAGSSHSMQAAWSGLTAGRRYLGGIYYSNGTQTLGSTFLRVNS
jgi:hypothetical protein